MVDDDVLEEMNRPTTISPTYSDAAANFFSLADVEVGLPVFSEHDYALAPNLEESEETFISTFNQRSI